MMRVLARRDGFSLVELLTVIAIIAILAAIIFPVMSHVKGTARMNKCITNLQQIGQGLAMFKTDNRRYPSFLGGKVLPGMSFENAKAQDSALFPEYVKGSYKLFHCDSSKISNTSDVLRMDLGRQGVVEVYAYDSYDAHPMLTPGDGEIHYTTSWVPSGLTTDEAAGWIGDSGLKPYPPTGTTDTDAIRIQDYERQLRFRNPPGDAVVTWCACHETREGSVASSWGGRAPVLFLDGSVDNMPANEVEVCKWRLRPKKS